jgi:hypothetical protein
VSFVRSKPSGRPDKTPVNSWTISHIMESSEDRDQLISTEEDNPDETYHRTVVLYHSYSRVVLSADDLCTLVYYESMKREVKSRPIYEGRCDERLKTKGEESTFLVYTGFLGGLEHLKIETRLIDEMFASVIVSDG